MKLSIYEVYVNIEDQTQADRMKQICIDYGLSIWGHDCAFEHLNNNVFSYSKFSKQFFLFDLNYYYEVLEEGGLEDYKTQVTESEFLELVKMLNKC